MLRATNQRFSAALEVKRVTLCSSSVCEAWDMVSLTRRPLKKP